MDLIRHLKHFLAVAEEGHFGRAAARLHLSQPPLSQSIQRLERHLGVRLFDRSARGVALTDAGRLLLPAAGELLARADQLHTTAERLRRGELGALRVGVPPDLGGRAVAALLAAFQRRRSGMELRLREISTAEQLRGLADRTLDVGLLRYPFDSTWLSLGPVLCCLLGVLLPAAHPAGAAERVRLAELTGLALVLFPRPSAPALFDEVLTTCARHGFTPTEVHQVANPEFALGLVLAGGSVAFTDGVDPPRQPEVVWRPLVGQPLAWRTSPAWPRGRHTPAVAAFVEAATEALAEHAGMRVLDEARPRQPLHPRPTTEFFT
ncbi:LysR family transcriptional regulator [Goodfellowiella coeruleoviolacea]|uniref:DNA-binding transcriptional regulator, LysR family n=1 Tax=Goodfellowiella coeruleoviolacea TaxID=334858 RepID=A0AAE3GJY9_9PSEU|nr:LysR substrate-binding domain-containing protein [Goodfellowiella coeruleoviolacea]MCP2169651.1 DNA-binding transcriptional regulator, LysR family [Goodfellowiella coeruleoviolacea]